MKKLKIFRLLGCLSGALIYYLFISITDTSNIYKLVAFSICTSLGVYSAEKLYKTCADKKNRLDF